jgi:NAD/NADP transhydrogenase alpha subunit
MMIDRAVQILDNVIHDNYIEMAETELGMETNLDFVFENDNEPLEIKEANSQIFKLASQLQAKEWAELFRILEGPNHDEYVKELEKQKLTGFSGSKIVWEEWYDGTGLSYWWD